MIAPPAMVIYAAKEQLADPQFKEDNEKMLAAQLKEIHLAVTDQPEEFYEGYMLGMQTARVLLSGMMNAIRNRVEI